MFTCTQVRAFVLTNARRYTGIHRQTYKGTQVHVHTLTCAYTVYTYWQDHSRPWSYLVMRSHVWSYIVIKPYMDTSIDTHTLAHACIHAYTITNM